MQTRMPTYIFGDCRVEREHENPSFAADYFQNLLISFFHIYFGDGILWVVDGFILQT